MSWVVGSCRTVGGHSAHLGGLQEPQGDTGTNKSKPLELVQHPKMPCWKWYSLLPWKLGPCGLVLPAQRAMGKLG